MMYAIIRRLQKYLKNMQASQAEPELLETELQGGRMTVLYSDHQILVLAIQQKDV